MVKTLVLEPGRYSGRWMLEGESLAGTIDLRAGRLPEIVLMRDSETSRRPGRRLGSSGQAQVLRGVLDNGFQAVLVGARSTGRGVEAPLVLVGAQVPKNVLFDMVEFQVSGLTELATVSPLVEVRLPSDLSDGAEFTARWNTASSQSWCSAEGDQISLVFTARVEHHSYGMTVASSPVMRVQGRARTAWEWLREYVTPMEELTTLATDRAQRVAWVQVGHAEGGVLSAPVQVFVHQIKDQAAYDAVLREGWRRVPPKDLLPPGCDSIDSLIPLGSDGVDLAAVLAGWRSLQASHDTFHDYLVFPLTDPQASVRARLMSAVPALEALHDQLHGKPPPGRDEQRRSEVLDRVRKLADQAGDQGSPLTAEDMDFLTRRLAPSDGYKLAHRLKTLVEQDLSPELRSLLMEKVDPLPNFLMLEGVDRQTAWEAMATVRNRLGHGVTPVPTHRQVTAVLSLAHTLAIALALSLLGVPDTALRASVKDGLWKVYRGVLD